MAMSPWLLYSWRSGGRAPRRELRSEIRNNCYRLRSLIEGPLGGAHRRPANYACRDRLWSANSSMPFKEGRLPCKRREKWRSTKLAKKNGKVKTENMKICFKMHARAEVMPNRASKVGHFPLTRQNILYFAQHKAEMPSHKWWFWSQFGYGNSRLHTIVAKTVLRKCASHRRRGAHFHNIRK